MPNIPWPNAPNSSGGLPAGTRVPSALPVLRRGAHLHPSDGACLMEYVSTLAGLPFTDTPKCTDPLIGSLARAVNDSVGARTRRHLIRFAPDLAALPALNDTQRCTVLLSVLDSARATAGPGRSLARHRRKVVRHMENHISREAAAMAADGGVRGRRLRRLGDLMWWGGPGDHALRCALTLTTRRRRPQRDTALVGLLEAAVRSARYQVPRSPDAAPAAVRARQRGADSDGPRHHTR